MSSADLRGPRALCFLVSLGVHLALLLALHPLILSSERRFALARALLKRQKILLVERLKSKPLSPPRTVKVQPPPRVKVLKRPLKPSLSPQPERIVLVRPQVPPPPDLTRAKSPEPKEETRERKEVKPSKEEKPPESSEPGEPTPKMEEEPSFPLTSEPEEETLSPPPFEEIERLIEPPLIPLP
ncbi:MAG TPA: hypothetical protein EYP65_06440, partial [Armatimonadetes bacterium]|nr:hypothetical protein [Armatimonadota bacterium]